MSTNASTLLCLISNQRMQNVIPIFQRGLQYERVVMVVSQDRTGKPNAGFSAIAKLLSNAFESHAEWILYPGPVNPMSVDDSQTIFEHLVKQFGGADQVTINFTGGTKPMAIGAYQAGLTTGSSLVYVDTEASQLLFYRNGEPEIRPFKLSNISIQEILEVHGRPIDEERRNREEFLDCKNIIAERIYELRPTSINDFISLRGVFQEAVQCTQRKREKDKNLPTDVFLPETVLKEYKIYLEPLIEENLITPTNGMLRLEGKAMNFIDGGWLEGYVLKALDRSNKFMDVAGSVYVKGVKNELDVVCTCNGKLGIIECKAGNMQKTAQAALSRLRALRDTAAGVFGRSFLVTTKKEDTLSGDFLNRAKDYRQTIISYENLHKVEEIVFHAMNRTDRRV